MLFARQNVRLYNCGDTFVSCLFVRFCLFFGVLFCALAAAPWASSHLVTQFLLCDPTPTMIDPASALMLFNVSQEAQIKFAPGFVSFWPVFSPFSLTPSTRNSVLSIHSTDCKDWRTKGYCGCTLHWMLLLFLPHFKWECQVPQFRLELITCLVTWWRNRTMGLKNSLTVLTLSPWLGFSWSRRRALGSCLRRLTNEWVTPRQSYQWAKLLFFSNQAKSAFVLSHSSGILGV